MLKKIICTIMLLVLTVSVFALAGCDKFDLDAYKDIAKAKIDDYAATKVETDYSAENWMVLCDAVRKWKAAIDAAEIEAGVDAAVAMAKLEINEILSLNDKLQSEILNLYRSWAISEFGENYTFSAENFFYFGQYNGFYVFQLGYGWFFSFHEEYIDGLDFSHPGVGDVYAIKEDYGGTLKKIYEEGYLMRNDLEKIQGFQTALYEDYYAFVYANKIKNEL